MSGWLVVLSISISYFEVLEKKNSEEKKKVEIMNLLIWWIDSSLFRLPVVHHLAICIVS